MSIKHIFNIIGISIIIFTSCIACGKSRSKDKEGAFSGILKIISHDNWIYFTIKFEQPVLLNKTEVAEAELTILDDCEREKAYKRDGSKVLAIGTMWLSNSNEELFKAHITVEELKFID